VLLAVLERQQQQKAQGNEHLPCLYATRLPGTKKRQLGQRVTAEAKDIRHPGKYRDHVACGYQPQSNIGGDAGRPVAP